MQRKIRQQESDAEQTHQTEWSHRLQQADSAAATDRVDHYHCDHLGTPRELIDQHGKLVWGGHYKAWGRIVGTDYREVEQPLRFQGQYEDQETGLHYNRYRYYDPEAGRYVTHDPMGLIGGLNSYRYAENPTGWLDQLGLTKCTKICCIIVIGEDQKKRVNPAAKILGATAITDEWPADLFFKDT